MPINCSVFGCSAVANKNLGLSFHSFPKEKVLLQEWMVKLRHGKTPSQYSRVCSRHFAESDFTTPLSSCGSSRNRFLKPGAVPSLNLPVSSHPSRTSLTNSNRGERFSKRTALNKQRPYDTQDVQTASEDGCSSDALAESTNDPHPIGDERSGHTLSESTVSSAASVSSQPVASVCSHNLSKSSNQLYSLCLMNEKQLVHFTGFTRVQFECLWKFTVSADGFKASHREDRINSKDQLLLTLMKLRTNMSYQNLAFSFGIGDHTASKIFKCWIEGMYNAFKEVNFWEMYDKSDGEYDIVVDCTEIFIEGSGNPDIAQTTYSNYKSRFTFKALVGVTESGAAIYCSDLFGGCISDRNIVIKSGFLDHVKEGMYVLADKGFLIADLLEEKKATLNIPPIRASRNIQLTPLEVATTRVIANRRIVVEQVIGKAKNYAIITDVMPTHLWPLANKIFYVIFHFCNFKKKAV